MLDITKRLIYIDGKERTRELVRCDWIPMLGVYQVQFLNGSNVYSYKKYRVKEYYAIGKIPTDSNIIFYKGRKQTDIEVLVKYESGNYFLKPAGKEGWVCEGKDISIDKLCLSNPNAKNVFAYLKELDNGEDDVLKAVHTVEGNHARGRENQREVEFLNKM